MVSSTSCTHGYRHDDLLYAEVAVEAARALDRETYSYSVPEGIDVVPGHRVTVPFGRRTTYGFVVSLGTDEPEVEAKPIAGASAEPLLLPHQVALARLVADHYWVPLIECLRAMLPPRVRSNGSTGEGASSRQRRHSRLLEVANAPIPETNRAVLTAEQQAALELIAVNPLTLLHGVIASGKTEVYLAAAEQALGEVRGARLVAGSATPRVVAYHAAQTGELAVAKLTHRVRGNDAAIQLVDMRDELASGNRQPLSERLLAAVDRTLANEEQAILYLNRRGMPTCVMGRD